MALKKGDQHTLVVRCELDISFVILTWNSENYIGRCLASIKNSFSDSGLNYEVLVVDNGSSDGTVRMLHQAVSDMPGKVIVESLPKNFGTTVPRNIGLRRAKGEYICIMDSDVEVGTGLFQKLIAELDNNENIGLVVPKIFYPSGKWQKSHDRFPTILHKIRRLVCLRSMEASEGVDEANHTGIKDVDYAISALWLFRRSLIDKVGYLDEKIFYAPEDVDFCLRVWQAGYRVVYQPDVSIIHHTQEISRGWKLNRAKISHLKGLIYFFIKHRYLFVPPEFASKCFQEN